MQSQEVLTLEESLVFESFTHQDAFNLATSILQRVKEEKLRRIGIRVVLDGTVIFQYLMDGKNEDMWLKRKQKTIEKFGHSGYYLFLKNEEDNSYPNDMATDDFVICGGGFPLVVNHKLKGSFCVSGLTHDMDHQLIVDAFKAYLNK